MKMCIFHLKHFLIWWIFNHKMISKSARCGMCTQLASQQSLITTINEHVPITNSKQQIMHFENMCTPLKYMIVLILKRKTCVWKVRTTFVCLLKCTTNFSKITYFVLYTISFSNLWKKILKTLKSWGSSMPLRHHNRGLIVSNWKVSKKMYKN